MLCRGHLKCHICETDKSCGGGLSLGKGWALNQIERVICLNRLLGMTKGCSKFYLFRILREKIFLMPR